MQKNTGRTHFNSETARKAGQKSKRGKSIKTILSKLMEMPADDLINMTPEERKALPKELKRMSAEEMIWYRTMMDALGGDKDARRDIADRLEGKAKQAVELTGEDGEPMEVVNISQAEYEKRRKKMLKDDDC
jgi:hypothetical protein